MHAFQAPYRSLLERLSDSNCSAILSEWLDTNRGECAWLRNLATHGGETTPQLPVEDVWRLYALSRVSDTLISNIESGTLTLQDFASFMLGLSLTPIPQAPFHPFYHEINSVTTSPGEFAKPVITGFAWPGFMCGSLLVSRAGVAISAGAKHIRKSVAESSTLYWAYRRHNRPTEDLSVGWGSNSQWRTSFRRDYAFTDRFEYNVDANEHLEDMDIDPREKVELVRHRCFVVSENAHTGLWPYDLRHTERRGKP